MRDHTGRLVLAPLDPNLAPDGAQLIGSLRRAGFVGSKLEQADGSYTVGEAFFHLVAFTGCAVQVAVDPAGAAGLPLCHVRIAGPYTAPVILVGRNTRPPRCPACRAPLMEWRAVLAGSAPGRPEPCPGCATATPLCCWDWKESGGCARFSLWVEEVFPGEATPTDALMQLLAGATRTGWRYFYVRE